MRSDRKSATPVRRWRSLGAGLALVLIASSVPAVHGQSSGKGRWVGTWATAVTPRVDPAKRYEVEKLSDDFTRVILHYGFMESPRVPTALASLRKAGLRFDIMTTSFFLGRETIMPSRRPGMALWREHLFAWMMRSATSAMDFFKLPPNRVVEMGTQIEI